MPENNKINAFLVSHIGLSSLSETEQEEVIGYVWNAIHNRIFDLLKTHIDKEMLASFESRFETDGEKVFSEIKEIFPDFDNTAKRAVEEVIMEFKKVRDSMRV